ncbi:MAG: DUF3467 domain-containing protein [Patescibacteria group bacterium]|nr:DUF3467 domain-containing protein [Patescibacteria group bacterium]
MNQIQVKMDDATLRGVYANMMQVAHNREEFVLDFMNVLPPTGVVNARVIVSPGHLKRIAQALADNLKRYEESFGEIKLAEAPAESFGFAPKTN